VAPVVDHQQPLPHLKHHLQLVQILVDQFVNQQLLLEQLVLNQLMVVSLAMV